MALSIGRWVLARVIQALRCQVARASIAYVEEVVEIGARMILGQVDRFVRGEIGQAHPQKRVDEHIFHFDVAVHDLQRVNLVDSTQELKGDPFLLDQREKWPCAHAVVQVELDVLTEEKCGSVGDDELVKWQAIGAQAVLVVYDVLYLSHAFRVQVQANAQIVFGKYFHHDLLLHFAQSLKTNAVFDCLLSVVFCIEIR